MSCFEGFLALWRGPPTAEAKRLLAPTAHGDRGNDEDLTLSIAAGEVQAESRLPQLLEHDDFLADEAYEWAREHVVQSPAAEESEDQRRACSICGKVVLGRACSSPTSGILHFGCAAAARKQILLAREAKYLRQRRRKQHQERWEAARARRKPKQQPQSSMAASVELDLAKASPERKMEEDSCQGGLYKLIGAVSSWAADFQLDVCMSRRQMLKSWAREVQREEAEEASAEAVRELLGCGEADAAFDDSGFLGPVAKKCRRLFASLVAAGFAEAADVTQTRRKKRLVQQGSRGAHLARMTAARRGVRICEWSLVREHRGAHRWAHASTLGYSLSFAFSLLTGVYKGTRSMACGFADFARGLWNGELCRRGMSTGDLWPSVTAVRGRRDAYQFARLVSLTVEIAHAYTRAHAHTYMPHARMWGRVGGGGASGSMCDEHAQGQWRVGCARTCA